MNIAAYIDHTILKAETTLSDVEKLCLEAAGADFKAVCVPPVYVSAAKNFLADSGVKTATVIGFPFGYSILNAKLAEIEQAVKDGADELDVVINITAVKNGDWDYLDEEVGKCTGLIHDHGKVMKLIVESGILTTGELAGCCALVAKHSVDFIKTSTGYAAAGASVDAVKTMRRLLPDTDIKASGGIRSFAFAKELIEAGATRIGCSASLQILEESRNQN